jgi:hypothetical protein
MIEKKHRPYTRYDIIETIRRLPEHANIDDAVERLLFIQSLERGIAAAEAGLVISQDEIEREMAEWPE